MRLFLALSQHLGRNPRAANRLSPGPNRRPDLGVGAVRRGLSLSLIFTPARGWLVHAASCSLATPAPHAPCHFDPTGSCSLATPAAHASGHFDPTGLAVLTLEANSIEPLEHKYAARSPTQLPTCVASWKSLREALALAAATRFDFS